MNPVKTNKNAEGNHAQLDNTIHNSTATSLQIDTLTFTYQIVMYYNGMDRPAPLTASQCARMELFQSKKERDGHEEE
jgi:hypothetical protein